VIRVAPQPEPAGFDAKVRVPGRAFLARVPNPNGKQFAKKQFWKEALQDLKTAYNSICAYSCIWIPNNYSVDHFEPKTTRPDLAYEWTNYRLVHDRINSNKGDYTDVLDPFHIQTGWFILDIATLWVKPEPTLQPNVKRPVQATIDRLRLNDDQWVQMRFELLNSYMNRELTIGYLQSKYPFMASEIQRQGVQPK
jgi:hypothetical protein